MAILQNKLVWKSIEALYDEAVATVPDGAIDIGIIKSRPTALMQQTRATQTPLKTAGGDDVMARIDYLLSKLGEDDAPTAQSSPVTNNQATSTELSDEATATVTQADDAFATVSASISAPDDAVADMRNDGPVKEDSAQNDSEQALNDIATAIYQAQQNPADSDSRTANADLTPAFDMAVLSATIADEVRHSVSVMIAAEVPQMVRQAVVEAIREMPTAAPDQPQPKAAKKTRAKPGPAKKTTAIKKAVTKKASGKKAAS